MPFPQKNTEQFIADAKRVHGERFDYSLTAYKNATTRVKIICRVHGEFTQTPEKHLMGKGCTLCGHVEGTAKRRGSKDDILRRMKERHKGRYAYEDFEYLRYSQTINVICKEHGAFPQTIGSHISGRGCPKCRCKKLSESLYDTTESFIEKAKKVHGEKYSYERSQYRGTTEKVEILCKDHGSFWQRAHNHLQEYGCPRCSCTGPSDEENGLFKFVKSLCSDAEQSNRKIIAPYEVDVYIPSKKIAVEYNGLYWHSEKYKESKYHVNKLNSCTAVGVGLVQIHSDEWVGKQEIVKSLVAARLGKVEDRIAARLTKIEELDAKAARSFFEANHIQGFAGAEKYYGIVFGGEIVASASYSKPRRVLTKAENADYELVRFCNRLNTVVMGALGKLLKPVENHSVISYCDRRLFTGEAYKKVGFAEMRITPPSYCYVDGRRVLSRFQCQKHKIANLFDKFDPSKTEVENMRDNGFYRVFDCGNLVLLKDTW